MSSFPFNLALFFDRLGRVTPACLYGFGLAVVAKKILFLPDWVGMRTLALTAATVWAVAAVVDMAMQLRRPFSREYADAWLDWKNRAGGAVLARAGGVPVRVRPGVTLAPFAKSLALPAVFVCAALVLPAMRREEKASVESIRNRVAEAEELLAEREELIAEPDRQRFERQLEEMLELAEANPEAAAEALASFEKRLAEAEARRLERAAEALEAAADWLAAVRGEEGGADEGAARSGGGAAEAALATLREAIEEAVRGEGGLDAMPEAFQSVWRAEGGLRDSTESAQGAETASSSSSSAASGGEASMDAARREQLLKALREWSESMNGQQSAASGSQAGREGSGEGGKGENGSGSVGASAAGDRLLSAGEALDALEAAMQSADVTAGAPGTGGVTRGRADAPMLLGDPSAKDNASVVLQPLPPGRSDGEGVVLFRERQLPDEPLPPKEFRAPWRSAVDAPDAVRAGRTAESFGPARARVVEEYFKTLDADRR